MKSGSPKAPSTNASSESAPLPDLNAQNLKSALWTTLNAVKDGEMEPGHADAIASQAREILRTTNTQLRIVQQSKRQVPAEVINFAEG